MQTPWGESDYEKTYGPGCVFYGTPSHEGFKLDEARNAKVPDYMRRESGWYEGDCEWSIVAVVHPDCFNGEMRKAGKRSLKAWFPDYYTRLTGETVTASESLVVAEREFKAAHANKFVAISASGDWHETVPKGMVGVIATLGGDRSRPEQYFLVPQDEYRKGHKASLGHGFVVDLATALPWTDHP